jgi:hypothetical protein
MANRDELRRRGLRAYELGRLRSAARAALVVVPLVCVCAVETRAGEACACLGGLLLAAAVFLRWRSRPGADAARIGLVAGCAPLVAGIALARLTSGHSEAILVATSAIVSIAAGVWMGMRAARAGWPAATGVAILTASLGSVALGPMGVVSSGLGLLIGGGSAAAGWRSPNA